MTGSLTGLMCNEKNAIKIQTETLPNGEAAGAFCAVPARGNRTGEARRRQSDGICARTERLFQLPLMPKRHFPPPWTIEEMDEAASGYTPAALRFTRDCVMLPVTDRFRYRPASLVTISRRHFNFCLLQLPAFAVYRRALAPSFSFAREDDLAVSNGQSINLTNVGRAGAVLYGFRTIRSIRRR
jgi:hypothetical protein